MEYQQLGGIFSFSVTTIPERRPRRLVLGAWEQSHVARPAVCSDCLVPFSLDITCSYYYYYTDKVSDFDMHGTIIELTDTLKPCCSRLITRAPTLELTCHDTQ